MDSLKKLASSFSSWHYKTDMTTPNRLQIHWPQMRPLLLRMWPLLTDSDLNFLDGEFDRLVEVVKQRYDDPVITVKEAHIRQAVLDILQRME